MPSTDLINGYHAHVYFDAQTTVLARKICEDLRDRFGVTMGRIHEKPVGPHPKWSCQMTVPNDKFDQVIPWLSLNRQGLTIFTHPDTGQHLEDHRDRAIWMGELLELDLSIFSED